MEHIECSETLAYKIHRAGNYPEENIYLSGKFRVDLNLFGLSILKPTCFQKKNKNKKIILRTSFQNILKIL